MREVKNPARERGAFLRSEGNSEFPSRSSYPLRPAASRPALAAVLTRKGAARPYRLERLASGELALTKRVAASRHFLRVPPAIGIDLEILDWAEREGAGLVQVMELEAGVYYCASLSTLRSKGFPVNRGFGRQWALGLSEWTRSDCAQLGLTLGV